MIQTRTVELERFRNAVGFTATFKCWGNTRKAPVEKISTHSTENADDPALAAAQDKKAKVRLKLSKQLIISPEYDAIKSFFGELRAWTYKRSVPSFFKEGFQLCGRDAIHEIEDHYKEALTETLPGLIEKFLAIYPTQVRTARNDLEPVGLFNAEEYPAGEELRSLFDISWNWIAFTVPEGLPAGLRQAETEKLQRQFADAGDQITLALREAFHELIAHATDKLTTAPGEKPKVFRDSLIGNIQEFLDTFNSRNLMNDEQLNGLVIQAKGLLVGLTPQKLRDLAAVRENTRKQFEEIKASLSGMIQVKQSRRFSFDEPAPNPAPVPEPRPEAPDLALSAA